MRRIVLGFLVVVSAVFGAVSGPASALAISGAFTDDDGSVHEPDINAIAGAGITTGCGPSLYCPSLAINREQMATFLARALELPSVATGPFVDIAASTHAGNINAIAAAGITTGCSPTLFCPILSVTRDQMASFLVRALELPPNPAIPFSDLGETTHAADIAAIALAGITAGCGGTNYCPFNPVTRAQMASFLTRAFELERSYPQINLVEGVDLICSKDGLSCRGSVTVPYRSQYEVREGFYDLDDSSELNSPSTRVEVTVNGSLVSMTALPVQSGEDGSSRLFRGTFGLAPGTHTMVGRWFWDGFLEQTTTVSVTVQT